MHDDNSQSVIQCMHSTVLYCEYWMRDDNSQFTPTLIFQSKTPNVFLYNFKLHM